MELIVINRMTDFSVKAKHVVCKTSVDKCVLSTKAQQIMCRNTSFFCDVTNKLSDLCRKKYHTLALLQMVCSSSPKRKEIENGGPNAF